MKLNQQTFCQVFCGKAASSLFTSSLSASFHKVRHQKSTVGREGIKREVSSGEIISFSKLNVDVKRASKKMAWHMHSIPQHPTASSCTQRFSSQLIEIHQQFSLRQELSMDAEQEPNFTRDPPLLTTFL